MEKAMKLQLVVLILLVVANGGHGKENCFEVVETCVARQESFVRKFQSSGDDVKEICQTWLQCTRQISEMCRIIPDGIGERETLDAADKRMSELCGGAGLLCNNVCILAMLLLIMYGRGRYFSI